MARSLLVFPMFVIVILDPGSDHHRRNLILSIPRRWMGISRTCGRARSHGPSNCPHIPQVETKKLSKIDLIWHSPLHAAYRQIATPHTQLVVTFTPTQTNFIYGGNDYYLSFHVAFRHRVLLTSLLYDRGSLLPDISCVIWSVCVIMILMVRDNYYPSFHVSLYCHTL